MFNLQNILAVPFDVKLVLTDELTADIGEHLGVDSAVEKAVMNRPEVQAQSKRIKAAELAYGAITGERLPSLVAQGDYGLIGNRLGNGLGTYNMSLLLQVPLFDGAQREGRIAEARSQIRQEALRLRSVQNQVTMEVYDAVAALSAAKEQVALAHTAMQMATKEFDLARERYAVMTSASYFELTNGLAAVAKARDNLVTTLFELNAARVQLARATGNLHTLH